MAYLSQAPSFILLLLGFGFVVFWHELGHFLAAKWAGVKVEQFAVGFGTAACSWRRGMGFTWGSSGKQLEAMSAQEQEKYGETEYRLNWLPLGGYVKMLGQDDLRPGADSKDPRSYNMKPVSKRMIIVSAGVVMNIILAMIGFMILYLIGFNRPPAVIGSIVPDSPAQKTTRADGTVAPLQVGDRILMLDGKTQLDFTKISLETALMQEKESVPLTVKRRDGIIEDLLIKPERLELDPRFVMLGIGPSPKLEASKKQDDLPAEMKSPELSPPDVLALKSGDVIVAINGLSLDPKEEAKGNPQYWKLDEAIQNSVGKPVTVTVRSSDGQTRDIPVHPHFERAGNGSLSFAGMLPRPAVEMVIYSSPARGQLRPGDVITGIAWGNESRSNPTGREFTDLLMQAGKNDHQPVTITVLRDGQLVSIPAIKPTFWIKTEERWGLGISLAWDDQHPIVAGTQDQTPARTSGIPDGAMITAVAGKPVSSWSEIRLQLMNADSTKPVAITARTNRGEEKVYPLALNSEQIASIRNMRYGQNLQLQELLEARKTHNPIEAAHWGVIETRDLVLQFYLTIKRMFQGTVGVNNMMGPLGMVAAGTKLAYRGTDWLIWFLSLISANLAVVNFLPIPIVDGGLFMFLILEKIKGSPLSPRAQSIAQVVGLALLLGVFLLVTYQDINRLF